MLALESAEMLLPLRLPHLGLYLLRLDLPIRFTSQASFRPSMKARSTSDWDLSSPLQARGNLLPPLLEP